MDVTLGSIIQKFPAGQSVGAYPASQWPGLRDGTPTGAPPGAASATATVQSDGTIPFTGLADNLDFFAGANVGGAWRYVRFSTRQTSTAIRGGDSAGGDLTGTFPNPQLASKVVGRGDLSDGLVQTKRVTTGSVPGAGSVAITIPWDVAFANANYSLSVALEEATTTASTLRVHHIESKTASQAVVRVVNDDAVAAKTGTLHAVAMHD